MSEVSRSVLEPVAGGEIGSAVLAKERKALERDDRTHRQVEKSVAGRGAEAEKARVRFERLEKIRAAVFERAAGRCEAWFEDAGLPERCGREAAIMDRCEGSGRDSQREGMEMYWALCVECSRERITKHPDAARWHRSFELHRKASRQGFTSNTKSSAWARGTNAG